MRRRSRATHRARLDSEAAIVVGARATAFFVLLLSVGFISPVVEAQPTNGIVSPQIRDRAARDGNVRVLVELRLPGNRHLPEGEQLPAAVVAQRSDIAR